MSRRKLTVSVPREEEKPDSASKTEYVLPLRLLMDMHNALPDGAVKRRLQEHLRTYQAHGLSRPWLEGLYYDVKGRLHHDGAHAEIALKHAKSGTYAKAAAEDLISARRDLEMVAHFVEQRRALLASPPPPLKGLAAVDPPVDRDQAHPKLVDLYSVLGGLPPAREAIAPYLAPATLPAPARAARKGRSKRR